MNETMGQIIRRLRKERNLTQEELAEQLGVTCQAVSKWENGQAFPRIDTFEKLAAALDTSVENIFSASKDLKAVKTFLQPPA